MTSYHKEQVTVYISGVWDLFHIGHLNVLQRAKDLGDRLVVGVVTDEFVEEYKGQKPVIPFEDRYAIVRAIRYVDAVVTVTSFDLPPSKYGVTIRAHGPGYGQHAGQQTVINALKKLGIRTALLPRTKGISTTIIRERLGNEKDCVCSRSRTAPDGVSDC
jgi:glycerol-3-phosphate cytidylyltransferase